MPWKLVLGGLLFCVSGCSSEPNRPDAGQQRDLAVSTRDTAPTPDAPPPDLVKKVDLARDAVPDKGIADGRTPLFDLRREAGCQGPAGCAWPAEPLTLATNLTPVEGPPWDNEFYWDLSGAVWNPKTQQLWVCRNTASNSRIWVLEQDAQGNYTIGHKDGKRGEWEEFGDLEALTLVDFDAPEMLYLMVEGRGWIRRVDLSSYGVATIKQTWNIAPHLISGEGAEGITFVPDSFLSVQGFVDESGAPYTSKGGMGGLMLVGHQTGGHIYAFDLNTADNNFAFVGRYATNKAETAGLEFDRSSGNLYIWHDSHFDELEVARLSSTQVGNQRKLDTIAAYGSPGSVGGLSNHEGIAVMSLDECSQGKRGFFLTTDGGLLWSLMLFKDFPCR